MIRNPKLLCAAAFAGVMTVAMTASAQTSEHPSVVPCKASFVPGAVDAFRYPALAQKDRRVGPVYLRVLVDAQGAAQTVAVRTSSGSLELDRAARIGARNVSLCLRDGTTRAAPGYAQMRVNFKVNSLLANR